ncbi:MAG: hypothetical protein O3B73_13480 [bacterium]|nr:hypothetical protein [bacterium]
MKAPKKGRAAKSDENQVFGRISLPVAVAVDLILYDPVAEQLSDKLVQRAVWTNPVAEKPAEEQGWDQQNKGPDQALVKGVRGDRRGDGNQRVRFKKNRNGIALQIPELRDKGKKQEKAKEECLGNDPNGGDFHGVSLESMGRIS